MLIVLPSRLKRPINEYADLIETKCRDIRPLTVIVRTVAALHRELLQGNWFFAANCSKNKVLYQNGTDEVNDLTGLVLEASIHKSRAKAHEGVKRGESFLKGAVFYQAEEDYGLSAFMCHQAAEQILGALILYISGYHERTHNLNRLLQYCSLWVDEVNELFGYNDKGHELCSLLQKTYEDARYKDGYTLQDAELEAIIIKVRELLKLARNILILPLDEMRH